MPAGHDDISSIRSIDDCLRVSVAKIDIATNYQLYPSLPGLLFSMTYELSATANPFKTDSRISHLPINCELFYIKMMNSSGLRFSNPLIFH